MKNEQPILLAIYCIVYNQESYIRDCLDGFVMQKTNFRFVAVVHDDASTDKSAAIIREYADKYPDIIKPIYETENQWSKRDGSLDRIMNEAIAATEAKYIAFCEGDDYWIDPGKLQKQVDFLERNQGCDLCCSSIQVLDQRIGKFIKEGGNELCENYESSIIGGNDVFTATAVVRTQTWYHCAAEISTYLPCDLNIDSASWYWFAYHKKTKFMPESMAVYRVLENSASHTANYETELKQQWRFLRLKLYFLAKYPLPKNQSEVMGAIMQELNQVIELSRLCGERKVRQSKTFRLGKFLKNIFRR